MNLIQKLPEDIKLRIIPYTYSIQPKQLLRDIIHYTQSFKKITTLYNQSFWIYPLWGFFFDITLYVQKTNHIWNRSIKKYNYNSKLIYSKNKKNWVNILWGLLTIEERTLFIQNIKTEIEAFIEYLDTEETLDT